MATYVQEGLFIDYTPVADVAVGAIVIQGRFIGIATRDLEADVLGALAITGVFEFDLETGDTFTVGALAYLIVATGAVTTTAGANTLLGKCWKAPAATDTVVQVRLCPDVQETGA